MQLLYSSRLPPRTRQPAGPVPTIEQLRGAATSGWFWVCCANPKCLYEQPTALAPLVIRFGARASSDVLRRRAVCPRCGHRGATLLMPSWCAERGEQGRGPLPTHYRNGLWSHRPFHDLWPGMRTYGERVDTTPPGPFTFGD